MYPESPENRGIQAVFLADSSDITLELIKDLDRQAFFPSNGRTYEDHVAAWMAPSTSKSYSQGNITAAFYQLILENFIFKSPKFVQEKTKKGIPSRKDEDRIQPYLGERGHLSLAYFDDQGVPCGVTITYSKLDPTLWTAAIIRNTTADPEDREVLVISPEDIMDLQQEGLTNARDAADTFEAFLRSKSLKKIMGNQVFLDNGAVNIGKLNTLCEQHQLKLTEESRAKISDLRQRDMEVKKWALTPKQFDVVKVALEAKQQDRLMKAEQEYQESLKHLPIPAAEQSFLRRNAASISIAALSLITLISVALIFSGVFAPLGLALISSGSFIAAMIGAGGAAVGAIASGVKIGLDEQALSDYQAEQPDTKEILVSSHKKTLQVIGSEVNIVNNPKQIVRAVLAADFSEKEFTELLSKIDQAEALNSSDELFLEFCAIEVDVDEVSRPADEVVSQAEKLVTSVKGVEKPPVKLSKQDIVDVVDQDEKDVVHREASVRS